MKLLYALHFRLNWAIYIFKNQDNTASSGLFFSPFSGKFVRWWVGYGSLKVYITCEVSKNKLRNNLVFSIFL